MYLLLSDQEVNTFLPWFPVKNKAEAKQFYKERLASSNKAEPPYSYAICFKEDPRPIGYVTVGMDDSYDFGYALRKEFWHKGLVTEASRAVVAQLMKDGLPKREGRFPFFKIPRPAQRKAFAGSYYPHA